MSKGLRIVTLTAICVGSFALAGSSVGKASRSRSPTASSSPRSTARRPAWYRPWPAS
uniref:Uncharacterized protein n=1 Tax=Phenylobacterium glaciei TaxID=2803784 RepID=A0A974P6K1_9CAUL|nr:hypothetical protein JKL49_11220 [Phenylobacterium glaciei]